MLTRVLFTALLCVALPSLAEDEDDLAPLAPIAKPKPKAAPVRPKAPPVRPKAVVPKAKPPTPVADDDLTPLGVAKGELVVRVLPATVTGAVLMVDGKEVGGAPSTQSLTPGEHTVMVKRPGFSNFVKKVTIAANKTIELDAKLAAVFAVLTVSSDVPEAQVLINNKLIGTTPIAEREWPAGTFEITIRKESFKEDKQTVTFVAGRDYPISVKFKPPPPAVVATVTPDRPVETSLVPPVSEPPLAVTAPAPGDAPLYQRWYFWAGVAVVVAAGVGVGIAVAQPSAKPRALTFKDFNDPTIASCINIAPCAAQLMGPRPVGITF